MPTEDKYVVETIIEADVNSKDGSRTCTGSMGGVTGFDLEDGKPTPFEAAKQAVQEHERIRWLERYLKENEHWDSNAIKGAAAQYRVRAKVEIRSAEGRRPVGKFEFEEQIVIDMAGHR